MRFPLSVVMAALLGAAASRSATCAEAPVDTHNCATVQDPASRLACYDKAFGRPPGESSPELSPPLRQGRQEFGFSEIERQERFPETTKKDTGPRSIEGTIASLRRDATGRWLVTLDGGQVWMQAETTTQARLREGDSVTIRKAALGSYVLVTASRIAMKVRRIQ